jgi:B-box zinc finger
MTAQEQPVFTTGDVPCARHPNTPTRLRCSRCGTPICPKCAVRTPVGFRCPECAGVRGLPTYATPGGSLLKAGLYGLGLAVVFAALFAWIPEWNFYLSLALGFGVAEAMARAANEKRGTDLQILGIVVVLAGMALGRVFLAYRLDLTWDQVNAFSPFVERALHMELSPDGLFVLLTALIPWYRFR